MTITKEWLKQTISELEQERDATPGAVNEDAGKALEAMRIALASLEAEPVADVVAWSHPSEERTCDIRWRRFDVAPGLLYAAPPASVSVAEPIKRNDADGWYMYKGRRVGCGCAEWYNRALDDCRAAMLQGGKS